MGEITAIRHPDYDGTSLDKFRLILDSGDDFKFKYLQQYTAREDANEFQLRREMSYVPAFAKEALIDVRNAFSQRAIDVNRTNGSESWKLAITGHGKGVDGLGSSIECLVGNITLELLGMSRVGVFVDMASEVPATKAMEMPTPYCYLYKAEDILSWDYSGDQLISVLLRAHIYKRDPITDLPMSKLTEYRLYNLKNGNVQFTIYDDTGKQQKTGTLPIPEIPFIFARISESLLTVTSNYQIAMMNLASSDLSYMIRSNFPFYIEQYDRAVDFAGLMRDASESATSTTEADGTEAKEKVAKKKEIEVGIFGGRKYPKGLNAPEFINPSSEPVTASMSKQEVMKSEIRLLTHLTISNLQPVRASSESKEQENGPLEAGLAIIGRELERVERKIGEFWCNYENTTDYPTIKYPRIYKLRSEDDRNDEAKAKLELMGSLNSITWQREIAKDVSTIVLGHRIHSDILSDIHAELDKANVLKINVTDIDKLLTQGVMSPEFVCTDLFHLSKDICIAAEKARIQRLSESAIAQSQGSGAIKAPGQDAMDKKILNANGDGKKEEPEDEED